MVAPKHKAIALTNHDEIKEAVKEIGRLMPDRDKILLLIDLFNQVHDTQLFTYHKYAGCPDCQRNLKQFWNYVIAEWNKR